MAEKPDASANMTAPSYVEPVATSRSSTLTDMRYFRSCRETKLAYGGMFLAMRICLDSLPTARIRSFTFGDQRPLLATSPGASANERRELVGLPGADRVSRAKNTGANPPWEGPASEGGDSRRGGGCGTELELGEPCTLTLASPDGSTTLRDGHAEKRRPDNTR